MGLLQNSVEFKHRALKPNIWTRPTMQPVITKTDLHCNNSIMTWWHFPSYLPFVRGIHRSPVNSPHEGQWRRVLMLSLICALNKRLSTQSWGWWFEMPLCSSWRHCSDLLVCRRARTTHHSQRIMTSCHGNMLCIAVRESIGDPYQVCQLKGPVIQGFRYLVVSLCFEKLLIDRWNDIVMLLGRQCPW